MGSGTIIIGVVSSGRRCVITPTDAKVASVVTVNRYSVTVFCYLTASPSPRCFRPKTAQCLCIFCFFVVYDTSTIFYLLRDDVTRSFAVSLHPT